MKKFVLALAVFSLGACSSSSSGYRDINEYEAGVDEATLTRPKSLRYSEETVLGAFEKDSPEKRYAEDVDREPEAEQKKENRYEYRKVVEEDIPVERGGEIATSQGEEAPYVPQQVWKEINITPDVYKIAAARATNRLLDETASYYEQRTRPTIYIKLTTKSDESLPDGLQEARIVTQDIIAGTNSFILTGDMSTADYVLETSVNTMRTENSQNPTLVYRTVLLDKSDKVVKEFTDTLNQPRSDDGSWW